MPKLLMLKGLPGSGKTTYAKSLKDYKRVNMDDLRRMLDDGKWTKANEKSMQNVRSEIISHLLHHGHNVLVDDTNFHPKHEDEMRSIAKNVREIENVECQVEVKLIDTPLKECIANDLKREHSVGKDVIMRMYKQYLKPPALDQEWDIHLPICVIVDIDGTVAKRVNRGPYEWSKVGDDMPKLEILDLVTKLRDGGKREIIFMSGRDEVCKTATRRWLEDNFDPVWGNWQLHMRAEGDQRKDTIVKKELYEEHVAGKYNVHMVIDDRDCMVEMWRDMGFTCIQVDEGDF